MKEKLLDICLKSLIAKNIDNETHQKRLKDELREIDTQKEYTYFLDLYEKKTKCPNNNNLLVPYLLGICDDVSIDEEPRYDYGDFPDVDIDFEPHVRTYLKDRFSREQYGNDYVCNIATYTTFGLRSAIIDTARVLGLDRNEVIKITTSLSVKDDEGEVLSWDKAIELYDDLAEYLRRHPDLEDAAKRMLNRNRNIGQHASGLIISRVPIMDFVPMVMPRGASLPASAWVEGLHGTDLGAVGLVKMDFLSLDGNMKIALACRHVQERAGNNTPICALPGQGNWSDTTYLNDTQALAMANKGDLKMIFQFDGSEGIRRLAKEGGVTRFDDLVAYASLYRPGPMKRFKSLSPSGKMVTSPSMAELYINRKRGKEKYEVHPELNDFLETTYGVLVYQEQIMRILNVVGKIQLRDCEAVRKAISKKKVEKFIKYKDMFVENGQETLGWTKKQLEHLWGQIEAFASYGFNASHATAYAYISSRMLYLKSHHPIEFYAAVLTCTHPAGPKDYQRLKDYKQEAEKHNITVERLDLNASKFECVIKDDKIYYGFSKIKGIGEETAKRIVSLQPYDGFIDFITRFGTDAKVVQALCALKIFNERDPVTLYKFCEVYKKWEKKNKEREKRYKASTERYRTLLTTTTGEELEKIKSRAFRLHDNNLRKLRKNKMPTLDSFCPSEVILDPKEVNYLENIEQAEKDFYGFIWQHPLEKCPEHKYNTIEKLNGYELGPLEALITGVREMQSKKTKYYIIEAEDVSGETCRITVWKDDYERFQDRLITGNLVRMTVKTPQKPFPNFTLDSNRWKRPPVETDNRVKVLKR